MRQRVASVDRKLHLPGAYLHRGSFMLFLKLAVRCVCDFWQLGTGCRGIVSQRVSCGVKEGVPEGDRGVVRRSVGGASELRCQLGCGKCAFATVQNVLR